MVWVCQLSFQVLEGSVSCEYMLVFRLSCLHYKFYFLLLRNYDHFLKLLTKILFQSLSIKIPFPGQHFSALSISHLDVPARVPGSGLSGWTAQEDLPRPEHVHSLYKVNVSRDLSFLFLKGLCHEMKMKTHNTKQVPLFSVHAPIVFTIFCFLVDGKI